MRALVLGLRRYDFKDDDGQRVNGVSLHYVMPEASEEEDEYGHMPMKENLTPEMARQLSEVPAFYELEHKMRPGRNSKPTPTLTGITFAGPASLDSAPATSEQAS